ncbi:MAG TPA: TolC family outer membrane protein [Acetobacteraceae bacterium]|nr:TolC family outer membrane protein [Acetobacteraceae bacterium]
MGALVVGLNGGTSAGATTLTDALVATYGGNPTLTAQRAQLRATDEQAAIVRAAGRPTLGGSASYTQGLNGLRELQGYNRSLTAGAQLSVPLFQGGRVHAATRAADSRVASGRQTLRATEGDVFVQAVSAYLDVLRDRAIVELNLNNVKVLQTTLEATTDRFQVGDLTRTDVAQSQARLQDGQAQLIRARSNLVASEENYRRVVGQAAGALDQPPPLPVLPENPDKAEDVAISNNPDIAAAAATVKATHYDVSQARASRMPTVSASAGTQYYQYMGFAGNGLGVPVGNVRGDASQAGVTLNVPLYQGGLPGAQVRQAQAFESAALENETAIERQVVANARAAFSSYQAAVEVIRSSQEALKANTLALEGVRAEQGAGLRQVLDTLNAEQEKLSSEVQLVSAQHDAYVAGFALLNAMGLVDYKHLGLEGGALYDPTMNYRHAIHARGDWSESPTPKPVAKPTYGPQIRPENPPVTSPAN